MIQHLPWMAFILAAACGMAVIATAQEPQDAAAAPPTDDGAVGAAGTDDPWAVVEPELPARESPALKRRAERGRSPLLAGQAEGGGLTWMRTIGALGGVVALILFMAWGYRALATGRLPLAGRVRHPGLIEVISRAPLSARQSLCLVRVGPRLVLVGQSQDTLRALDVIDDADLAARLAGQAAQKRAGSSLAEFHGCLEREARAYDKPRDAADDDEPATPDTGRIADVQRGLTKTIQRIRQAVTQG